MVPKKTQGPILNIVPVQFSTEKIIVGKIPELGKEDYQQLREENWQSHVFRFDKRSQEIFNIPFASNIDPIGDVVTVNISDHLLLLAKAIQHSLLLWLTNNRPILYKSNKKLIFWDQAHDSMLLSKALQKNHESKIEGLEVVLKYEVDCRMFYSKQENPYLGLVIDLSTSNIIDIPISELISKGLSIHGRYVCAKKTSPQDFLEPKLELLGSVSKVDAGKVFLIDSEGGTVYENTDIYLEPRQENLRDVINLYYGDKANLVLKTLNDYQNSIRTANGKLDRIRTTLNGFKKKEIKISNDVGVEFEDLLQPSNILFPEKVSTERPTFLFGPQGRKRGPYPDRGITTHGPYMFMQHERNEPTFAVICESKYRGRFEQFMQMLLEGYPDEQWNNSQRSNPFSDGLTGKYRLSKIRLEFEEINNSSSAQDYENAIIKLLNRLATTPDLAIVQIREDHAKLFGADNPYYTSKVAFMMAGVPTQSIKIENIELPSESMAYLLNNIALAIYAKLDGIPWVISTLRPTTHEIVMGLGAAEVSEGRFGKKSRYVGITSVFQGDGRYLVSGATREVEFEHYSEALLESLFSIVQYVRERNAWLEGDKVRIVFHVYKRLRDLEVAVIKNLVSDLVDDNYQVEFAFLDISWYHPFHIFSPKEDGKRYWDRENKKHQIKGKGVPQRGLSLLLDKSRGLIQLTGPGDLKTHFQGTPKPLLIELHPASDFSDMTYLIRQIFHFSFMSWRSYFPSTEPITIKYSKLIARQLGNLKMIDEWNSQVITVGPLRDRKWFL